jgi:hypothetical protein
MVTKEQYNIEDNPKLNVSLKVTYQWLQRQFAGNFPDL